MSTTNQIWSTLPAEYAIPAQAPSLAEAYAYCERLARSHDENFSVASWFLPKRLRQSRVSAVARRVGGGIECVLLGSTAASRVCGAGWNSPRIQHSQARVF